MNNIINLPTVDIVFPIRNRDWILPHFLKCLLDLDYPKKLISIIIYINDSIDNTEKILNNFKKEHELEYNKIYIKKYDLGTPEYGLTRGGLELINKPVGNNTYKTEYKNTSFQVYKNLAKLRNSLLNKTDSDYVFSVDTDIMFGSDILNKFLSYEKDFVSALICNGYISAKKANEKNIGSNKPLISPYVYPNIMRRVNNAYTHIRDYENKGLLEVDLSGAISLMSNSLVKNKNIKYYDISADINGNEIHYGEDAGFCESAKKEGFSLFCDTGFKCTHIMSKEYLDLYLNGEFVW